MKYLPAIVVLVVAALVGPAHADVTCAADEIGFGGTLTLPANVDYSWVDCFFYNGDGHELFPDGFQVLYYINGSFEWGCQTLASLPSGAATYRCQTPDDSGPGGYRFVTGTVAPGHQTITLAVGALGSTPVVPPNIPSPCDGGCDDGDACTIDACAGKLCAHTAATGVTAVQCLCDRALPAACADVPVPKNVMRPRDGACAALRAIVVDTPARKMRRLVKVGLRRARTAARRVGTPGHPRTFGVECSAALVDQLNDLANGAAGWLSATP